jgi:hypothetical protein
MEIMKIGKQENCAASGDLQHNPDEIDADDGLEQLITK